MDKTSFTTDPSTGLMANIQSQPDLFIRQQKEWVEIFAGFETANKYIVMDAQQRQIGFIAEHGSGFAKLIARWFLKSHRPLYVEVMDISQQQKVLEFRRKFFFFFSDLWITAANSVCLGSVHRRFGILFKKYDLRDAQGNTFATIRSPLWRLWKFPISINDQAVGAISKKWSGVLREAFSDADTFRIEFGQHSWSPAQRAVIFGAAISIDFDFFEDNSNDSGIF